MEQIYREVKPPPRAKHGLSKWISKRAESKLESFHENVGNFGNTGMGHELCDALNLCGTARYNRVIRQRIALGKTEIEMEDKSAPATWQTVVSFLNHTELAYINNLAKMAGAEDLPFKWVEPLPDDNGERFFSEYLKVREEIKQQCPKQQNDRCPCLKCGRLLTPAVLLTPPPLPPQETPITNPNPKPPPVTPPVPPPVPPPTTPPVPPAPTTPQIQMYQPQQHYPFFRLLCTNRLLLPTVAKNTTTGFTKSDVDARRTILPVRKT